MRVLSFRSTSQRPTSRSIDKQRERLAITLKSASEEVPVCFLGHAGVGKSTLLNALVSDEHSVLPQGGVGPLTAQATLVRYAPEPFFRVSYFDAATLRKLYLVLEGELTRSGTHAVEPPPEDFDEETRQEASDTLPAVGADGKTEGPTDKVDAYKRQVRLLIQGDQFGEINLPYLIDSLRAVLGLPARLGRTLSPEDAPRVARVREVLALREREDGFHHKRAASDDLPGFLAELREHASGFLSPIIRKLEVGWAGEALVDGLVLVDLPGVGVANDEYRHVTTDWVRNRARAIVLVVDRAGVTEESAALLRDTGFFANLLHSSHDPTTEPPMLAVAVVKLDLSADDAWRDEKAAKGSAARKWSAHFQEVCGRATDFVRDTMQQELRKLVDQGAAENREELEAAARRLSASLLVFPVSATEFRKFNLDDEDERPRIKSVEESRVPEMRAELATVARVQRERMNDRAQGALLEFAEHVRAKVDLIQAQWERDSRAEREAAQLTADLDAFLAPKLSELERRQGAFREFIRESIPAQIEARVGEAKAIAQRDIVKYLSSRRFQDMHWSRLRAAIRKGGTHETNGKRHIDLPNELTIRFEEPLAVIWSKHILTALRKRTAELGADYVSLVGEVVEWARGESARVQPRFVEALHADLSAQTKELSSVGKQAVDELKQAVQLELYKKLEQHVRKSCERFVKQELDIGAGVKHRILEYWGDELAKSVVEAAQPIALQVLLKAYEGVQKEISEALGSIRNPLQSARDTIVQSHEDSLRRSDTRKRKQVLADVEVVLGSFPQGAA